MIKEDDCFRFIILGLIISSVSAIWAAIYCLLVDSWPIVAFVPSVAGLTVIVVAIILGFYSLSRPSIYLTCYKCDIMIRLFTGHLSKNEAMKAIGWHKVQRPGHYGYTYTDTFCPECYKKRTEEHTEGDT